MPTKRKRRPYVEEEPTHGEIQQRLINKYHDGHFEMIKGSERLLRECQKQFEIVDDPGLKKSYESMIIRVEKDLRKLRDKNPEVLRETERMQKDLDSLK